MRNSKSTRRTSQVGAGVEEWRTEIGGASSGGVRTAHTTAGGRGRNLANAEVGTELNQFVAEHSSIARRLPSNRCMR